MADRALREPLTLNIRALVTRTAMHETVGLLALPLRYLCPLLKIGQRIERVSREANRLRYPEVALVLGE